MESVVRIFSIAISIRPFDAALLVILTASAVATTQTADAAPIEAIRGKDYGLTAKHGPWMIMVTSLWGNTPEQEQQAEKAAKELVFQLRKKGIPAYVYRQDDKIEKIDSTDRQGRRSQRRVTAQHGMIAVLAGNYRNADDKVAQQTLKYVKKFNPKVDVEWQGKPLQVPLVLDSAFLAPNPVLSPEEFAKNNRDPLIIKLNSNVEHSLLANKGKYTLVVASFNGQSSIKPTRFEQFDRLLTNKAKISLDNAARESWELMTTMRKQGIEAYLYHDRYRSIVTVGSFKSDKDPRIAQLIENFRAKETMNPQTKQMVLTAECIQIPGKTKGGPPLKGWIMDPYPKLLAVP
jgi:hypothetical protein